MKSPLRKYASNDNPLSDTLIIIVIIIFTSDNSAHHNDDENHGLRLPICYQRNWKFASNNICAPDGPNDGR